MGTPLSPTPHPAQWDVPAVVAFLAALAPSQAAHAPAFRTHGIAGDVLLALDAAALRELGVRSVGQRLVILTGVWRLKQEWGIALDDGEWRPSCECAAQTSARGGQRSRRREEQHLARCTLDVSSHTGRVAMAPLIEQRQGS
jgi:hypothetical protein